MTRINPSKIYSIQNLLNDGHESSSKIGLSSRKIGNNVVRILAGAIKLNPTTIEIYLPHNRISNNGALAFAHALKYNVSLKILSLADNNIGNVGAGALSNMLRYNKTLLHINLQDNLIDEQGADCLAACLLINETLLGLYFRGNMIRRNGAMKFKKMISHNSTLLYLPVAENGSDIQKYIDIMVCWNDIGRLSFKKRIKVMPCKSLKLAAIILWILQNTPLKAKSRRTIFCMLKFSDVVNNGGP